MSKAKAINSLDGQLDTDMNDELDSAEPTVQPSPDSNQENNAAPGKRGRYKTKPASAKFSNSRPSTKRTSGGTMAGKKKAASKKKATGKRVPLKEQTTVQHASDTEGIGGFNEPADGEVDPIEDASMDEQPPAKETIGRKKPAARGRKAAAKESKPQPQATAKDGEFEYTPIRNVDNGLFSRVSTNNIAPRGRGGKRGTTKPKEIPETQVEPMHVDPPSIPEEDEDAIPQSVYRQTSNLRASSKTRQPPVNRRRAGSASDTERTGNDPALRRKLGEMTKKVDNLEMRYNNLREVGVKEAEANFEKLKAVSEAKSKGES